MQYNPVHPHCGPFNYVDIEEPDDPVDAICWRHDKAYGEMQSVGRSPMLYYNEADEQFIHEMRQQSHYLADAYTIYFEGKRLVAPHDVQYQQARTLSESATDSIQQPSMSVDESLNPNHFTKMGYKRRTYSKKRYGGKRKYAKTQTLSKSDILKALAPPKTLKVDYTQKYDILNETNDKYLLFGGEMRSEVQYRNLRKALDPQGDAFEVMSGSESRHNTSQYCTYSSIQSQIRNNREDYVQVQPIVVWFKRNFHIQGQDASPVGNVTDNWQVWEQLSVVWRSWLQGYTDATDDAYYSSSAADADARFGPYMRWKTSMPVKTPIMDKWIGMRFGKKYTLQPGGFVSVKYEHDKMKVISGDEGHNSATTIDGYDSLARKGHYRLLLWKVVSPPVTSAEADLGANEDEKAAAHSSINLTVVSWIKHVYKGWTLDTPATQITTYADNVTDANQRAMIQEDYAVDNPEEA